MSEYNFEEYKRKIHEKDERPEIEISRDANYLIVHQGDKFLPLPEFLQSLGFRVVLRHGHMPGQPTHAVEGTIQRFEGDSDDFFKELYDTNASGNGGELQDMLSDFLGKKVKIFIEVREDD